MKTMKAKYLFKFTFLMIAAMTLVVAGCTKDKTTPKGSSDTESMQQLTKDNNNFENVTDQAVNDANSVLTIGALKTGGGPCNTTVTVGNVVNDSITIDIRYHGRDCPGTHYRVGHILIKKKYLEPWGTPGATVLVTLANFAVTKVATQKTLTLNGIKHFENVTGHYLWQLDSNLVTSIEHRIWGTVSATFDNGTSRTWNLARQRVFTGILTNLVMTVDGFGSADGYTNLSAWGINRNGEQFYTQITQSIVYRQVCDFDPCSGIMIHQIPAASKSATVTYGYDSNNNLITNGDCPTRYRVDWVNGSSSGTLFLPL
jgi:hypothetical protein